MRNHYFDVLLNDIDRRRMKNTYTYIYAAGAGSHSKVKLVSVIYRCAESICYN